MNELIIFNQYIRNLLCYNMGYDNFHSVPFVCNLKETVSSYVELKNDTNHFKLLNIFLFQMEELLIIVCLFFFAVK